MTVSVCQGIRLNFNDITAISGVLSFDDYILRIEKEG